MSLQPAIAPAGLPKSTVREPAEETHPVRAGAATILMLAAWIGLIAGFLDLGLMAIKRRVIDGDFYRLGERLRLDDPVGGHDSGVGAGDRARLDRPDTRGSRPPGSGRGASLVRRLPRHEREAAPGSVGVAALVRWARRAVRPGWSAAADWRSSRLVRRTVPLLAGAVCDDHAGDDRRSCLVGASGGRRLAPAARRRPECAADRLGYGPRRQSEPPRLRATRRRPTSSGWPAAACDSTWRSRRPHGPCRRTRSLFTGRWPHELGVDWKSPLRDDVPTLAEYLAAHGYDTAGFAANLDYCSRETGLARGFAHYEDYPIDLYEALHPLCRPWATGSTSLDWACILGMLLEKFSGRCVSDADPRSREHAKNAAAVDSGIPGLALPAAGAPPPVLRLPELQRCPLTV